MSSLPSAEHTPAFATQAPFSQTFPVAQSSEVVHVVRHASVIASHANAPHETTTGVLHFPAPSQVPREVDVPSTHEAGRHSVSTPTFFAHVVGSTPSHEVAAHASVPPDVHRGRAPCGLPLVGVQVPFFPSTSQASH
jgi:hypothetical protein